MKRWATNLFCLFSLLVFVSSVTLWVRSYFGGDFFEHLSSQRISSENPNAVRDVTYGLACAAGKIAIYRWLNEGDNAKLTTSGWLYYSDRNVQTLIRPRSPLDSMNVWVAGFQLWHAVRTSKFGWGSAMHLVLPLWLFLPAAIPPILWLRRRRKGRLRGFPVVQSQTTIEER